jgi:hypothetical protein
LLRRKCGNRKTGRKQQDAAQAFFPVKRVYKMQGIPIPFPKQEAGNKQSVAEGKYISS